MCSVGHLLYAYHGVYDFVVAQRKRGVFMESVVYRIEQEKLEILDREVSRWVYNRFPFRILSSDGTKLTVWDKDSRVRNMLSREGYVGECAKTGRKYGYTVVSA